MLKALGGMLVRLLPALSVAACAGQAELASLPEAVPDSTFGGSATRLVTVEDSSADLRALQALHELEFRSLAKGGNPVRGVVPALDPSRTSSRGGTASLPVSSLDHESFADHRRVQYYVDFFLDDSRRRFNIWLGRMARYEGMIRNVFRKYELPEDLLYLGLIESGYSNTAVSRANAIGMWQFIRSTGRRYGLRIDSWVDERRDPFKSTDAAARHLRDLQEEFGSWYLAAAAYNGGAGRVSRGLERERLNDDAVSDSTFFVLYDTRWIRRETKDYVPKLIAATMVAQDPAAHGFDDIPTLEPLVFDEITVPDQTSLDVLANLADTTIAAIKELNPQYYREATPPDEQVTVRVPRGSGNMVAREYAALPPSERAKIIKHTVRRGETMGEIAEWYGVGLSHLRAVNPSVRPRRMRIGQVLLIPLGGAAPRGKAPPPPPARTVPPSGHHTVRWGDTLWIVSQRYGVTVRDLRIWNDIPEGETLLQVGQRLRVRS
jgi:membrane-bound lytic murein transglycosylase D